jgi:hypothetical protein
MAPRRGLVVVAVGLLALAIGGAALALGETDGARAAARATARWSLFWFAAAYLGGALLRRDGELSEAERSAWVGLAAAHVVHLGFVALAVVAGGFPFIPVRALGGALAYALLLAIAYGAHRHATFTRPLADWGGLYIAFVFFETYRSRLKEPELSTAPGPPHAVLLGVVCVVVAARWAILVARRRRR